MAAVAGTTSSGLNSAGFYIGQQVSHAKFGTGIILNSEGSGTDMRVQVNFHQAGTKWLSLAYAKLEPL